MKINVLGVNFDNLTFDEALERALELTERGGYCVTPNPEFAMCARNDAEFAKLLKNADLAIADGIGIIYGAKILKRPLKARIPGIELAETVIAKLAERPDGRGLFLFGGTPGTAELAAANFAAKYPGLKIAGTQSGYGYDETQVIKHIAELNPALVLVCLGMKRQEMFMSRATHNSQFITYNSLMMGLGGAIDVFAGTVKRAPERWRRLGLEWLYRLLSQPSRIGRMMKLPLFMLAVIKERIFGKNADNV